MFDAGAVLSLYAESGIHAGAPGTGGAIDRRVQRDPVTGLPIVYGSGVRGVWREEVETNDPSLASAVFGPPVEQGDHAGAISVLDAQLLLFPVREASLVWVWVTSPLVMAVFRRALERHHVPAWDSTDWRTLLNESSPEPGHAWCFSPQGCASVLAVGDHDLRVSHRDWLKSFAEFVQLRLLPQGEAHAYLRERLPSRLLVVGDPQLRAYTEDEVDFVTRIRLNDRKTTTGDGGNMWTEEILPSECVFYVPVLAGKPACKTPVEGIGSGRDVLARALAGIRYVQVGSNESVGRGYFRVTPLGAGPTS